MIIRKEIRNGVTTILEISWHELLEKRKQELDETDWRAVKDRTMSQAWKDYRQFLRDLPQNYESAGDAADAWNEYEKPDGWM
tara:strand:- start:327 stop:572 length:246 start_codon:yes stop_codon:yes gene_type:complete